MSAIPEKTVEARRRLKSGTLISTLIFLISVFVFYSITQAETKWLNSGEDFLGNTKTAVKVAKMFEKMDKKNKREGISMYRGVGIEEDKDSGIIFMLVLYTRLYSSLPKGNKKQLARTEVNILHKAYPDSTIHRQGFIPENIKITEGEYSKYSEIIKVKVIE
jgi:hypothetical protein